MRKIVLGLAAAIALVAWCPGAADATSVSTGWTQQPVPVPGRTTFGGLNTVSCTSADRCMAVGVAGPQHTAGFATRALAERWNGSSWAPVQLRDIDNAFQGFIHAGQMQCIAADSCFVPGWYFTVPPASAEILPVVEYWNGRNWTIQQVPLPPHAGDAMLTGLSCLSADNCFAVGSMTTGSRGAALAEHWDGHTWAMRETGLRSAGTTVGQLESVSCPASDNCTAIGEVYQSVNGESEPSYALAEHWDGSTWSSEVIPAPSASPRFSLAQISCPRQALCLASGSYYDASYTASTAMSEIWNGTSWAVQPLTPPADAVSSQLNGISCVSAVRCTAVGNFFTAQLHYRALAEYWDGSSWAQQQTAAPASARILEAVSCTGARVCTAVGYRNAYRKPPLAEAETGRA